MFDGTLWGPTVNLASADNIYGCNISADNTSKLHVAWHDLRHGHGNYEIYYRRFNGLIWEPEVQITDQSARSHHASVASDDSGQVHLVWSDERQQDRAGEIYYKRFDGVGWSPGVRLTQSSGSCILPSLAVGPDQALHVVWRDSRGWVPNVYYKTRPRDALAWVDGPQAEAATGLKLRVVPNPVWANACLKFHLQREAKVCFSIFSVSGRLVWKEDLGLRSPGPHQCHWTGIDQRGLTVAPGIYIVRVAAGSNRSTARIVVLR
jgi:hypothetical protein